MGQQSLLGTLALDMAIQWVAWAFAALLKTEKFYDLTGSLTFVTLAVSSLLHGPSALAPRARLMTSLVCVWAARLGSYLVTRIAHDGKDSRFDKVRDKPGRFLVFWTVQGLWCFVTSLPVLLVNNAASQPAKWGVADILGVCSRPGAERGRAFTTTTAAISQPADATCVVRLGSQCGTHAPRGQIRAGCCHWPACQTAPHISCAHRLCALVPRLPHRDGS